MGSQLAAWSEVLHKTCSGCQALGTAWAPAGGGFMVLSDPITPPICWVYGWGRHHYAGADARGHFEA